MTDKLSAYSTTAASNNSATPDGWPEGMAPSDVNNCAREMMARLREFYVDSEWIDHGHTIQSSTASTVVVSGDHTSIYVAGRAFRVNQSGSQVGRITSSSYLAPNTTINIEGFTVSGPTQIEVGAVSSYESLPGMTVSLAVGGYQKLPSGVIFQWGTVTATVAGAAVTFPITFPNACFVVCMGNSNGGAPSFAISNGIPSTTGFTTYSEGGSVSGSYIAVGY